MNIHFEKANMNHIDIIFGWLAEPNVQEFWDNTQGHTYGVDYMIGDKNYFGKGYGDKTLVTFLDFFRKDFDSKADRFIIDPASDNPRAKHVYMKAGFKHIDDFVMGGDRSGAGKLHHLLGFSLNLMYPSIWQNYRKHIFFGMLLDDR